jgi:hypothetical protein
VVVEGVAVAVAVAVSGCSVAEADLSKCSFDF